MVTIQYRSKHMLLRPYEYDSIVQNPISEADFKWILHRNCEGTEQLRIMLINICNLTAYELLYFTGIWEPGVCEKPGVWGLPVSV